MLTIAAYNENGAQRIRAYASLLAVGAIVALAASIFLIKHTYLNGYNIKLRYFYILGASCAIDFVYLVSTMGSTKFPGSRERSASSKLEDIGVDIYKNPSLCREYLPQFVSRGNTEATAQCLSCGSILNNSWDINTGEQEGFLKLIDNYLQEIESCIFKAIHPNIPLEIFQLLHHERLSVIELGKRVASSMQATYTSRLDDWVGTIASLAIKANRADIVITIMDLYPLDADKIRKKGAHLSIVTLKYADQLRAKGETALRVAALFRGATQSLVFPFASPEEQWQNFFTLYQAYMQCENINLDEQLLRIALNLKYVTRREANNRVIRFLVAQPDFKRGWLEARITQKQSDLEVLRKKESCATTQSSISEISKELEDSKTLKALIQKALDG